MNLKRRVILWTVIIGLSMTKAWGQSVTNGLAVYLNFDNNLNAQAGTAYPGMAFGAAGVPVYGAGAVGAAAVFNNDGSGTTPNDWAVSLGDIESIYTNSWSFSLWVNATNANDGTLFGNKDWTSRRNIGWEFDPSRTSFLNYRAMGGSGNDIGNANVIDGKWHHIVANFDRSTNLVSVYTDGARTAQSKLSVTPSDSLTQSTYTPNATLVGSSGNGLYSGAGSIDELAIWTRTLSDAEILAIYAQGIKGLPLTSANPNTVVPPILTLAPANASGNLGFATSLTVGAIGTPPLTFQWYKDGALLPGATNQTLTFNQLNTTNAGNYLVVVANGGGKVTNSPAATVTVKPGAKSITDGLFAYLNFDNNLLAQAGTINSATAIGDVGVPRYTNGVVGTGAAWFQNDGSAAAHASDWAASLGNIEPLYTGNWSLSFWVQTKDQNPAIVGNKDWNSGGNIGWVVGTSYTDFLNYKGLGSDRHDVGNDDWRDGKWHHIAAVFYRDGNEVYTYVDGNLTAQAPLGTTGTESLTPTEISTTLVGSSGNASWSANALVDDLGLWSRPLTPSEVLAIYAQGLQGNPLTNAVAGTALKPALTTSPQSQSWIAGFPATFSATATGSAPLTYQWFKNGQILVGQTNTSLTLLTTLADNNATFAVRVQNPIGIASNTTPAVLTVLPGATNLTDHLVVHLNFETNLLASPGTTYNATAVGNMGVEVYTNGIVGKSAAWFQNDGSASPPPSDWAASLGDVEWIYTNNWSFSIWVKTADQNPGIIGNKDWNSGGNIGWVLGTSYVNFLNYRAVGSARHDVGNFDWRDNQWHHVAATFYRDANTVFTFVDGRLTATAGLSATGYESLTPDNIVPNATLIGSSGNGAWSANALVDDTGIWTRPLTPGDVAAIYAAGLKGLDISQAQLAAPTLSAQLSGTNLLLSYPVTATPWTLQSATNLLNPTWLGVNATWNVMGGSNVTSIPIGTSASIWYRLSQ